MGCAKKRAELPLGPLEPGGQGSELEGGIHMTGVYCLFSGVLRWHLWLMGSKNPGVGMRLALVWGTQRLRKSWLLVGPHPGEHGGGLPEGCG